MVPGKLLDSRLRENDGVGADTHWRSETVWRGNPNRSS